MLNSAKQLLIKYPYCAIALIAWLLYVPFLGGVHLFDWDEINFAEAAREMVLSGNYSQVQIDFQPFWEKPPLFLWMQALSMQLLGINEYAARFPNALCGLVTLLFLFHVGQQYRNQRFAWWWVLAYMGSILPHLYFKSGIIDPWFNLFIFSGLYFVFKNKTSWKDLALGGNLIGLAILTKGPVAFLIVFLVGTIYWGMRGFKWSFFRRYFVFCLWSGAFSLVWVGYEIWENGWWFIEEFVTYQIRLFSTPDAGHGGFLGYHFVVLLVGCFPASIFAIRGMKRYSEDKKSNFHLWNMILFWVVIILFSIVKSKIVHYSSLCYFPLTFLAAYSIYNITNRKWQLNTSMRVGLIFLLSLFFILTFLLPIAGNRIELIRPLFSQDAFAMANLDAQIEWRWAHFIPSMILLCTLVCFLFFRRKNQWCITSLFIGSALFIQATLILFINNIEGFSQRAAIEFYKTHAKEDAYFQTIGFKSYAHLFYGEVQMSESVQSKDKNWLLTGTIDKDVYLVTKINGTDRLKPYSEVKELYRKNGFVFFLRKATTSN